MLSDLAVVGGQHPQLNLGELLWAERVLEGVFYRKLVFLGRNVNRPGIPRAVGNFFILGRF